MSSNKKCYVKCKYCRFVKEDSSMNEEIWIAYECGNPKSEYYKSLLNIDLHGNKNSLITWSGCSFGERRCLK